MARHKTSVPRFCVDENGRAFTKVAGRFYALGRENLPDAKLRFAKILEDHAKGLLVERAKKPADKRPGISVAELLLTYVSKELPRFSRSERDCQTIKCIYSLTSKVHARPASRQVRSPVTERLRVQHSS